MLLAMLASPFVAAAQPDQGDSAAREKAFIEALRREEVNRGLVFDYLLITAGTSLNRAPSEQRLVEGDIISLDSGGNYKGYIGDLCRMGIIGDPDPELVELLGFVDEVQQAVRRAIKPGGRGFRQAERHRSRNKEVTPGS